MPGDYTMNECFDVMISDVSLENGSVASICMRPKPEAFMQAKAGQYLLIQLQQDGGWTEFHPFTITSKPGDDYVRITVKKVGKFTSLLHSLTVPASARIKGPLGTFGDNLPGIKSGVFIAGGIGITPFISLLESLYSSRSEIPVALFWANEKSADTFYLDVMKRYQDRLNLKVIMVVNSPVEKSLTDTYDFIWENGFLTRDILSKYIGKEQASFYMCGSPNMQKYIFSQLADLNIASDRVAVERVGLYMAGPDK
jgi:predicted ferric reductase